MGQFGILDILRSHGVYKVTYEKLFALFEPDEEVYDVMAAAFSKNGFILCRPPKEYKKAIKEPYRFEFALILCSDRREDLNWLKQFFPSIVEYIRPPIDAITPLPHGNGKLYYKWHIKNTRAAVAVDEMISHARNPMDKHLFKLLARAYYPTQRLPGDEMDPAVLRLRESTCHEVNSICTSWYEENPTGGIPTYNQLLSKAKNYKVDRKRIK